VAEADFEGNDHDSGGEKKRGTKTELRDRAECPRRLSKEQQHPEHTWGGPKPADDAFYPFWAFLEFSESETGRPLREANECWGGRVWSFIARGRVNKPVQTRGLGLPEYMKCVRGRVREYNGYEGANLTALEPARPEEAERAEDGGGDEEKDFTEWVKASSTGRKGPWSRAYVLCQV